MIKNKYGNLLKRVCPQGYVRSTEKYDECLKADVTCDHGTPKDFMEVTRHGINCSECDTGYTLSDTAACVPYTVTCDHGTANDHMIVTQDGENCVECDTGYQLNGTSGTHGTSCVPFTVSCLNGTPKDHTDVTQDGENCLSCDPGYTMDSGSVVCRKFDVTCPHGDPTSHTDVTEDGENCQTCDPGYTMDPGSVVCRKFDVTCPHGDPTSHTDVTEDGENCLSCDPGYTMEAGSICRPTYTVTCEGGTPKSHLEVESDGEHCQSCDAGLTLLNNKFCVRKMNVCDILFEKTQYINKQVPEPEIMYDPIGILLENFSNKAPTGWNTNVIPQQTYFHTYQGGTWVRDKSKEFGPFPSSNVTVYTSTNKRGFIFSSGEYPCDDDGTNCAMKYQDQVEGNIAFADYKQKRDVGNKRPVLGRAEEWKKLGCLVGTKIETIDFTEFVVRTDCPAYTTDDVMEYESMGYKSKPIHEHFLYPSCQLGFKANSAIHYTHNDRTDPSRMRNRANEDLREPRLHTPHICSFYQGEQYYQNDHGIWNDESAEECREYQGMHPLVPVETLSYRPYSAFEYIKRLKTDQPFTFGNVFKEAFHTSVNLNRERKLTWLGNTTQGIVSEERNNTHLLPPSMKGWVWCEDINEVSSDTDDNHGYCTGIHPGNKKKEDPHDDQNTIVDETSYEETGHGLAMAPLTRPELPNYKYIESPNRRDYEDYTEYVTKLQTYRPMVNSLILKNDEAGIDGIALSCSNQLDSFGVLSIIVTGETCTSGETLCYPEQISNEGTAFDTHGELLESTLVVVQYDRGTDVGITKCPLRELTENECSAHATDIDVNFTTESKSDRPSGCFMDQGNVYYNTMVTDIKGIKLCPTFTLDQKDQAESTTPKKLFCCDANQPFPITSHLAFNTNSNVNENMHYEFMCVNEDNAIHLCDPHTGDLVDFQGNKKEGVKIAQIIFGPASTYPLMRIGMGSMP